MITVFLEPKDWVPAKRSLYADKGGKEALLAATIP